MFKLVFSIFFNTVIEFLPISSTAHSILLNKLFLNFGFSHSVFETLNINLILAFSQLAIDLGLCFYFKKEIVNIIKSLFFDTKNTFIFLIKILITMLPTLVFGIIFYKFIKNIFSTEKSIALCLILGSILMFFAEKRYSSEKYIEKFEDIDFKTVIKIGLMQSLSMLPGFSRSASTISAGLFCNLPRKFAVLFSFFISIPIGVAASFFDIYKNFEYINMTNLAVIFYCFLLSFFFTILVCKKILNFLSTHKLDIFIYYRVIFGIILLLI